MNKTKNGRQPQKKMEDDLKKMKTTSKKNLFSIPLKFKANLSWDWLSSLRSFLFSVNIKPPRHRFGFSLAWGWQ
jgi:hypothetical protein